MSGSPDSPYIEFRECNHRYAVATWSFQQGTPPVQFFEVEYARATNLYQWTPAARVDAPETSATVPLPPYGTYVLRVTSHNAIGAGSPSSPTASQCTTPMSRPSHNPANVRAVGARPDYLTIEWTAMPEWEHNGPGFRYRLTYRKVGGDPVSVDIDDWETSSYVVATPGEVYEEYDVTVTASNALGSAREDPITVRGYTGEIEPGPVENIRIRKTTSSSLQVAWDPPSSPNGVVTDYNLALQQVNDLDLGFLFYVMDGQNVTSADASDLEPGTTYRVHVTACSDVGCGQSNYIQVATADASTGDVARDYDVDETCRDRLRVAWSVSPRDVNDSSIYVRYRLTGALHWRTTAEEHVRICADSNNTDVRPWWRVIDKLDSDTSYQIQLVIAPSGHDVITSYVTTVVTPSAETSACSLGDMANASSPALPLEVCKQEPSTTAATSTSVTGINTTADPSGEVVLPPTKKPIGPTSLSTQILPSLAMLLLMLMAGMAL